MTIDKRLGQFSADELKEFDCKLELLIMFLKEAFSGVKAFQSIEHLIGTDYNFFKLLSHLKQMEKDEELLKQEDSLLFTGETPVSLCKDKLLKVIRLSDGIEEQVKSLTTPEEVSKKDSKILELEKEIADLKKEKDVLQEELNRTKKIVPKYTPQEPLVTDEEIAFLWGRENVS